MSLNYNFELMADYNHVMNERVYNAASKLRDDSLSKDQGAFFGSIINTLNHILVGDTIWLQRFAHHEDNYSALDYVMTLESPTSLDSILYSDFRILRQQRETLDGVIKLFTKELTEKAITKPFSYKNTKGQMFKKNFGHVLLHFFNHQTHHRGQASTLLYQQGIDIGVTDLLYEIPDLP